MAIATRALDAGEQRERLRVLQRGFARDAGAPIAPLASAFDRVVAINLDRRFDRWMAFTREAPAAGILRFPAIDGRLTIPPVWWRAGPGAWGCLCSHRAVIAAARDAGVGRLLVFEDDACCVDGMSLALERFLARVPSDWDQLYLGGEHAGPAPAVVTPDVLRVSGVLRTHAYALQGRFIGIVAAHLSDLDAHAAFPLHHVDHRLALLHADPRYRVYAPSRWLVGQHEGISDVAARQTGVRFWQRVPELGQR